jgi:recombination protein RecA
MSEKLIEKAVADLQEKFGHGLVYRAGENGLIAGIEAMSSGSLALDIATKLPGLPKGRIIEYYGLESSGKSTMALRAVAAAQERGEHCAWIDAEQAFEPEWAKKHGVQMKGDKSAQDLQVWTPEYGEQAIEIINTLANTKLFSVIVLDSVAALMSKAELDDEVNKVQVGQQSRMMSQAMRRLTATMAQTKTTLILINQLREKIGIMYGNKYTTPGGLAIRFYSSVRVEFYKKNLKEGDDVIGTEIHLKIVKNKVRAPFGTGISYLVYGEGIDENAEIVQASVDSDIFQVEGRRYSFDGKEIATGMAELKQKIKEDDVLRAEIKRRLLDALKPNHEEGMILSNPLLDKSDELADVPQPDETPKLKPKRKTWSRR